MHQIIFSVRSFRQPVFIISGSVGQESGAWGGLNCRHLTSSRPWGQQASFSLAAALLRAKERKGQVGWNPQSLCAPSELMASGFYAVLSLLHLRSQSLVYVPGGDTKGYVPERWRLSW